MKQHPGSSGMGAQKAGHPAVKNMAPGPNSRQAHHKSVASPAAPSKGQTARSSQGGSTSPKTDGGGGMGNSSEALHRKIFGK